MPKTSTEIRGMKKSKQGKKSFRNNSFAGIKFKPYKGERISTL
jgi:hypothetical protein